MNTFRKASCYVRSGLQPLKRLVGIRSGTSPESPIWYNSLLGKVLLPVIGFMLLSMVVTGLVFNFGISATSQKILEGEVKSDNQKVISSLQGRLETGNAAAAVLANNQEIKHALVSDTADSLSIINSRALVVRDRFELDLVQIYAANDEPRTNLVQSSLYKVSSVIRLLPRPGTGVFTVDGRLVYLARTNIADGGVVIVGIDLLSELQRIAFQIGLRDPLTLAPTSLPRENGEISNGNYTLQTPFQIGSFSVALLHTREISQFERIANSGRNLILFGAAATTIFLIGIMGLVLNAIVRPVRHLADAARQLAKADFENTVPNMGLLQEVRAPLWIGTNDEIGQLAESFLHMSKELQGIYHGLVRNLRDANQELSGAYGELRGANKQLGIAYDDLREANKQLRIAYDSALQGWSSALELRDHDTQKHTERVAAELVNLARRMGVPEEELIDYRRGALLHDVGKMAIPDGILRKAGRLSEEEWKTMRLHPMYAFVMLRQIPFLKKALMIPYCHHEKWDGSGYPHGLRGEQIPLAARIFSVVDVWDALINDRPYRKAWPREKALEYIASQAGKEFDPKIVSTFLESIKVETIRPMVSLELEKA